MNRMHGVVCSSSRWAGKALHVGDTLVPVAPDGLPARLRAAGLADGEVCRGGRSFGFRARKRGASAAAA